MGVLAPSSEVRSPSLVIFLSPSQLNLTENRVAVAGGKMLDGKSVVVVVVVGGFKFL